MIPKIIHYCWFGHNPLPELALKCIDSWRKFFPDYEIIEWNENNFDVNIIPYTQQAYEAKKFAFVSDYARFWILYNYGGLYFDTDVEIIKPIDDIIIRGPFMGIEIETRGKDSHNAICREIGVNPGLGMGAIPGLGLYKEVIDYYQSLSFLTQDGKPNETTVVKHTTKVLTENGLISTSSIQVVSGIWIYPADYFNPLDSLTGKLKMTNNTRSIHWYMNSWSTRSKLYQYLSKLSHRIFGLTLHRIKKKLAI